LCWRWLRAAVPGAGQCLELVSADGVMCLIGSGSEDVLRAIDSPMDERPPRTVSIGFLHDIVARLCHIVFCIKFLLCRFCS